MSLNRLNFLAALQFIFIAIGSSSVFAINNGQIDTFQDGTVADWMNGGTAQPMNIFSGGPLGPTDGYMRLTADGSGANGRLTVFNRSQWLGDYVAAGVNEIDLDLNNFSNVTLSIRLAFKSNTFNGASGYVSAAFTLAPNSGWQHATFLLTPGTMTAAGTPAAFGSFFSGPAEFRIINSATGSDLNGDVVVGQLGIDNIAAVPEPGVATLLLGSAVLIASTIRMRKSIPINSATDRL